MNTDEKILEALEANYVLNRRIYDTLLVMLKDQNEELALYLDETHERGEFAAADVFIH